MQQLRIHAIPLADNDGKRKYTFTVANLTNGVTRAPRRRREYVSLPNAQDWDTPDHGNFIAHEVGHYLGLFHTHPGWGTSDLYPSSADTAAKAEQALVDFAAAHGGAPGAFNGDLLSETNPDCCRNIYDLRGLSHTTSVAFRRPA